MDKWFEDKLERKRLRSYTQKRLDRKSKLGSLDGIFRSFSLTNWLIIVNLTVFIFLFLFIALGYEKIISLFALQPDAFFSGAVWTVLTSMFMHVAIWHLLANMVSLFFIGNFVENLIGRKRFFWLYLFSGVFAGLFYAVLAYFFGVSEIGSRIFGSPETFALGASGAIFALLGLLAVLTPHNKVYLIVGPILALIFQSVFTSIFPSSTFVPILNLMITFYIIFSIISIFSFNPRMVKIALPLEMPFWVLPFIAIVPLAIIGLFVEMPIGNTAHLGGLLAGLCYGLYLKKKYKKKTAMIRKYFGG